VYGYPALDVSRSTVDATDAFLADPRHPAPLRRLVEDGRDGVVRALAARACDAAATTPESSPCPPADG
jgi:aminopeptidase N